MQRVHNYGSWLQAYALKQLLLCNGANEVRFVDIVPGTCLLRPEGRFARIKRILSEMLSVGFKNKWVSFEYANQNSLMFANFYHQLDPDGPVLDSDCDAVVIGSDEVFNTVQLSQWGYTPQLYGEMDCSYVFSYAGSFGHTTLEQLHRFHIADEIAAAMKTMKAISVRDTNSQYIVKMLIDKDVPIHLDPVLIYGYENEIAKIRSNGEKTYLLIYSYNGRIRDKKEVKAILTFAKSQGLRIMSLFCAYSWCDGYFTTKSAMEVLDCFKNAAYVVTDTFHGSIFSIITKRKFCTLLRASNTQKLTSLLSMLHLSERLVVSGEELAQKLICKIDYKEVESILSDYRQVANKYLRDNIDRIAALNSKEG